VFSGVGDLPNTTNNGWYAINKGILQLPAISVAPGNTSVNWGERPTDTDIDLVNSANVQFANTTAGDLDISLLAPGCDGVGGSGAIGVWDITHTGSFDSAVLTFRYDDNLASTNGITESMLRVYQKQAGSTEWHNVTGTVNTTSKQIVTQPISSFSLFAVAGPVTTCGDIGTQIASDLSGPAGVPDCYVNLHDLAYLSENAGLLDLTVMATQWLDCTNPADTSCN